MGSLTKALLITGAVLATPYAYPRLSAMFITSYSPDTSYCALVVEKDPKYKFEINLLTPVAIYSTITKKIEITYPGLNLSYGENGFEAKIIKTTSDKSPYECEK